MKQSAETPLKVLVIAPFSVSPPQYGGPLRVHNLYKALSESMEVVQFAQQTQRRDLAVRFGPLKKTISPHYVEYSSRSPLSALLFALTSLVLRCPPVWQDLALKAFPPGWLLPWFQWADIVQVEHPWQFRWVYDQVQRQKPVLLTAHNVESHLCPPQTIRAPALLARRVSELVISQERFAVQHASHVIALTAEDRSTLADRYGLSEDRCTVVPMGVDGRALTPASEALRHARKRECGLSGKTVILFAGSLGYANLVAVQELLKLHSTLEGDLVHLLVVGTIGLEFKCVRDPRVHFTGRVDSVVPFLHAADIAVNPMVFGSGMNQKILEYMAVGLPTVTTRIGARGVGLRHGIEALVCDLDGFPAALKSLIMDPSKRASLGRAARLLVEEVYDWSIVARTQARLYDHLVSRADQVSSCPPGPSELP